MVVTRRGAGVPIFDDESSNLSISPPKRSIENDDSNVTNVTNNNKKKNNKKNTGRFTVDPVDIRAPPIAFPTILLFIAFAVIHIGFAAVSFSPVFSPLSVYGKSDTVSSMHNGTVISGDIHSDNSGVVEIVRSMLVPDEWRNGFNDAFEDVSGKLWSPESYAFVFVASAIASVSLRSGDASHLGYVIGDTLILSVVGSISLRFLELILKLEGPLIAFLFIPIQSVVTYVHFTVAHDSAHRAVSSRYRVLNDMIGRMSAFFLCAPFTAFRYLHFKHHKNTNSMEYDPDMYSQRGPGSFLPIRWATQLESYYVHYLSPNVVKSRPFVEVAETVVQVLFFHGTFLACLSWIAFGPEYSIALFERDIAYAILTRWIFPVRLAILILAYVFDYVPHRSAKAHGMKDPFAATFVVEGISKHVLPKLDLTPYFLGQNYHLVHHLYPSIPWYGCKPFFWKYADLFFDKNSKFVHVFDSSTPWGALDTKGNIS